MKKYIMALDAGTTSSRCILFDRQGRVCSVAQREFAQHYPRPGWVEHDAEEIWHTQLSVARQAMHQIQAGPEEIAALGITNQRETVVVWDKRNGRPIGNAIVWQCRRTADYTQSLRDLGYSAMIQEKTGLVLDPYFSATKLHWMLENIPGAKEEARQGNLLFGTVDTWLMYKLTKGGVHGTALE